MVEKGELPRGKKEQAKRRERSITIPKQPKNLIPALVEQLSQDEIAEVYRALGEVVEKHKGQEEGEEKGRARKRRTRS
jgi:hypothetical protein